MSVQKSIKGTGVPNFSLKRDVGAGPAKGGTTVVQADPARLQVSAQTRSAENYRTVTFFEGVTLAHNATKVIALELHGRVRDVRLFLTASADAEAAVVSYQVQHGNDAALFFEGASLNPAAFFAGQTGFFEIIADLYGIHTPRITITNSNAATAARDYTLTVAMHVPPTATA